MAKVVDYQLYQVPPRWLFLKLECDDGTVGWGEPIVEGRAKTVESAVRELVETYLLNKDPLPTEDHWQVLYRGGFYRGGPILMSAIAGIDQALWDIKGKQADQPVHQLLGGPVRDRVRIYQWIGGESPAEIAENASKKIEQGHTALKLTPAGSFEPVTAPGTIDEFFERVSAVRDAVGRDVDMGVDLHGRATKATAKRLVSRLEEIEPMFVEEPLLPEHSDALSEIAHATSIPIATGERLFSRWEFKDLLEAGSIDILQPDLSHAGGITEVKKIAAMAEAYDVAIAPHCPLGPIALASSLQIAGCVSNVLIQEQSMDIQYNTDGGLLSYVEDPTVFEQADGFMSIPTGPGLGIEIDEEAVEARTEDDIDWHNPVWRYSDGSVAEW